MKKIKVAFFAEILIQDFDGASRTIFQILNRIPREEFEFMIFCGVPPDKDLGLDIVELPTFRVPYNKTYRVAFPFFSKKKLNQKLEEFQPDIIHFSSPSPLGKFAKDYGLKHNIPVVAMYHTHFISYIKYYFRKIPSLISTFYKKAIRITHDFYKTPQIVYTPTKGIIDELKNICQLEGSNLKVWHRGINTKLFNPNKQNKSYLKSIVKNDFPTILFASRLVWEKNLDTLIGLYELCEKQNTQVNFVIAGDGVARIDLEKKIPNAYFLGSINHEELSILYASADIFFFPSDTESFGNVVIEAMASGLPCVVANGGGPMSFVQDGVTGFLCPTNDVNYYWEKIQILLNDDLLRENMIKDALSFTQELSWEKLVNIYFDDLKELSGHSIDSPIFENAELT